ncbi:MAG TPA: SIMPL domain-containing protein [Methylomirabilota bacterium]|jgi:uncharacterized protein YggE
MRGRISVLMLGLLLMPGCTTVAPRGADDRGIAVTATGRIPVRPDTALIALGMEIRSASLADATAQVERTMRDVVARLQSLGVRDADVQTMSYRIDPIAEAQDRGGAGARVIGYRVANTVQVKSREIAALGRLVDAAVAAGANVVGDVHFSLEDARGAEARARALAVQHAHEQARQVAAAAGVRLGRLLAVSESRPIRPVARMSVATAPGPVEPGELDIAVTVDVRYAIDP